MKRIELKDLENGNEYIVLYNNIPCMVKVIKDYRIKFIRPKNQIFSPLEFNKEYIIKDFYNELAGRDIFGNKIYMLSIFELFEVAKAFSWLKISIDDYKEHEENPY